MTNDPAIGDLSSGPTLMGIYLSFLSIHMILILLQKFVTIYLAIFPSDYLLRWPLCKNMPPSLRDELHPINTWTKTIQLQRKPPFTRSTSSLKNRSFAVGTQKFIPHFKLFIDTEGYDVKDSSYLKNFSEPPCAKAPQ